MSGIDFADFEETTPSERNDYSNALRVAIAALKGNAALKGFVILPEHLKRESDYNAGGAFKGLEKTLNATAHKSAYRVLKGKVDGNAVVALTRKSA
jgi:hypothetical protein